ncbi:MAG: hypothetical protein ACLFUM_10870 [Spirochaetaceae bacterium]
MRRQQPARGLLTRLPSLAGIADAFIQVGSVGYRGGTLFEHLGRSMARLLSGFGLAAVTPYHSGS